MPPWRAWARVPCVRELLLLACASALVGARGGVRDWTVFAVAAGHLGASAALCRARGAGARARAAAAMAGVAGGALIGGGVDGAWAGVPWDAQVCACVRVHAWWVWGEIAFEWALGGR
jgi:hypothetical protein